MIQTFVAVGERRQRQRNTSMIKNFLDKFTCMHSKIPIEEDGDLSVIYLIYGRRNEVQQELELNLGYNVTICECESADDIVASDEKQLHVVIESDDRQLIDAAKATTPHMMVIVDNETKIHEEMGTAKSVELDSKMMTVSRRSGELNEEKPSATANGAAIGRTYGKARENTNEWVVLDTEDDADGDTVDSIDNQYVDCKSPESEILSQEEKISPIAPHQSDYEKLVVELSASKGQIRGLQLENEILRCQINNLRGRVKGDDQRKDFSKKRKHHLSPFRLMRGYGHSQVEQNDPLQGFVESHPPGAMSWFNSVNSRLNTHEHYKKWLELKCHEHMLRNTSSTFRRRDNEIHKRNVQDLPIDQIEALSLD